MDSKKRLTKRGICIAHPGFNPKKEGYRGHCGDVVNPFLAKVWAHFGSLLFVRTYTYNGIQCIYVGNKVMKNSRNTTWCNLSG